MNRNYVIGMGVVLTLVVAGWRPSAAVAQDGTNASAPASLAAETPSAEPIANQASVPTPPPPGLGLPTNRDDAVTGTANPNVKPLSEGPLHEAFLSPAKDRDAAHVDRSPPAVIVERPGVDRPNAEAQWIDGYWEWDEGRKDFLWVTGTWRVAPPGRFWVNGYWKRDDKGWYRVSGFWSDRRTDRLDYRKNGPPTDHPPDEAGESPGEAFFYVPGHYAPDGTGVVWKAGFWANAQPGWSWVPAQWVKQPEGWTYQDGYWDRTLEDRGTLFAPAEVQPEARNGNTTYQPFTQISPQSYGLLYGAFGRPNSYYDGYPGCAFDASGRYYGYAQYGSIGSYYGYLDYPFYGGFGYPYIASPIYGGYGYGGLGYGGLGLGLFGGLYGGLYGMGYPYYGYGGFGYGGFGYGGFGFGYPFWGFGFGYPFWGFGFGYPFFGFGGFGNGGYGYWRGYGHRYPFYPGGHGWAGGRGGNWNNGPNSRVVNTNLNRGAGNLANRGIGANSLARHSGTMAPPSSHAFANPFTRQASLRAAGATGTQGVGVRHAGGLQGSNWTGSYNGVHHTPVSHTTARPAFSSASGSGLANGLHTGGNGLGTAGTGASISRSAVGAGGVAGGAAGISRSAGAGAIVNRGASIGGGTAPLHNYAGMGSASNFATGARMSAPTHVGGYSGGYTPQVHMGGGYSGGARGFSSGGFGGYSGGGFSGGGARMGGFSGGGGFGGGGGGHGGGGHR